MEASVSVIVVDANDGTRRGLCRRLGQEPGIVVIGEATEAVEALGMVADGQPDAVVIHLDHDLEEPQLAPHPVRGQRFLFEKPALVSRAGHAGNRPIVFGNEVANAESHLAPILARRGC